MLLIIVYLPLNSDVLINNQTQSLNLGLPKYYNRGVLWMVKLKYLFLAYFYVSF